MDQQDMVYQGNPTDQIELTDSELALVEGGFNWKKFLGIVGAGIGLILAIWD